MLGLLLVGILSDLSVQFGKTITTEAYNPIPAWVLNYFSNFLFVLLIFIALLLFFRIKLPVISAFLFTGIGSLILIFPFLFQWISLSFSLLNIPYEVSYYAAFLLFTRSLFDSAAMIWVIMGVYSLLILRRKKVFSQ
jgi:hypothetical protein